MPFSFFAVFSVFFLMRIENFFFSPLEAEHEALQPHDEFINLFNRVAAASIDEIDELETNLFRETLVSRCNLRLHARPKRFFAMLMAAARMFFVWNGSERHLQNKEANFLLYQKGRIPRSLITSNFFNEGILP